jgi:hypothetical protein
MYLDPSTAKKIAEILRTIDADPETNQDAENLANYLDPKPKTVHDIAIDRIVSTMITEGLAPIQITTTEELRGKAEKILISAMGPVLDFWFDFADENAFRDEDDAKREHLISTFKVTHFLTDVTKP